MEGGSSNAPASTEGRCARQRWVLTNRASSLFGAVILANAIYMGIETDQRPDAASPLSQPTWYALDSVFNAIYLVECLLRLEAERAAWFCSAWNLFDAALVLLGIVDLWVIAVAGLGSDNLRFFTVMRVFRLLRLTRLLLIVRLFRFLQELWLMVSAIVGAMSAMAWSLVLMCAVFCVSAIFITRLVGQDCCSTETAFRDPRFGQWFGTVPRSLFTLFQFATLENWPDIARTAFNESPVLVIFIVLFIMFTHIMLLNTLAGIVVEHVLSVAQHEEEGRQRNLQDRERSRLRELFDSMDTNQDGTLEWGELQQPAKPATGSDSFVGRAASFLPRFSGQDEAAGDPDRTLLQLTLDHLNMSAQDAKELFQLLDTDGSGTISKDEFVDTLMLATTPPTPLNLLQLSSSVNRAGSRLRSVACRLQALDSDLCALCGRPPCPSMAADPPRAVAGASAAELKQLRQELTQSLADFDLRVASRLARRPVEAETGGDGCRDAGDAGAGDAGVVGAEAQSHVTVGGGAKASL